ncbi:MAG: hypothetical protein AB1673_11105 [Actinomycetota bacterium]
MSWWISSLLARTIVVVWKLAGRIYEQVLVRLGSPVAWRDAKALLRRGDRPH